jgi:hypothetical protein
MSDLLSDPDDPTRLHSCFHVLGRVEDQLRFADSKAGFLATLHAFLVSPLVYNVAEIRKAYRTWDATSLDLLVGFGSVYVVLFLVTMAMIGQTVLPRSWGKKRAPSRAYFGRIAREFGHAPEKFVAQVVAMSHRDWLDEIGLYNVDVSAIAALKHRYVRWATVASVPTVIFWCLTVLTLLCANLS